MRKILPYIIIGLLTGALVWALCRGKQKKQDEPVAKIEYRYIRESDTVRVADTVYVENMNPCSTGEPELVPEDSVFVYEEPDLLIKVCSSQRPKWLTYQIGIVDTIIVYRDGVVSVSDYSKPIVLPEVKKPSRWSVSAFVGPGLCVGGDGVSFGACVGIGVTYHFGK